MISSALLRQTGRLEPYQGESATGPLYGAAVEHPVRIQPKRRQVRDRAGDITVSDAIAFLRPGVVIAVGDRETVEGCVYRVLAVAEAMGLTQCEHIEATLGRSET